MPTSLSSGPRAAGEREAFDALYRCYADQLYAYCRRRSNDRESAEDACAVVFLEAWRRRGEVDLTRRPPAPWLYGVARNVLYNQRRSHHRQEQALSSLRRMEPTHSQDVSERYALRQVLDETIDLLSTLPPTQRAVVRLCALHEHSYEAAADALQIPVGTVRSRLSRARVRLASALQAMEGSGDFAAHGRGGDFAARGHNSDFALRGRHRVKPSPNLSTNSA
jgi:RNA polymerase sigma factor (sigma-70 family)